MCEPQSNDFEAYRKFEKKGWSEVASGYSGSHADVTVQTADALFNAVAGGPGMEILDVACGPGVVSAPATTRGAKAVDVDFAKSMIAEAKRRYPDLEFKADDAESLWFDDGTFDAVVCNFGKMHIAEPDKAIAESQTPEAREKIHAAIEVNAMPFTKDGIVTLALPAVVAAGVKPNI